MNKRMIWCVPLFAWSLAHCSRVEVAPELADVYSRLIGAVRVKDAGTLFDLAVPPLKDEFETLLNRMKSIEDAVITLYPASDHHALRQDLGLQYSEGCSDARCLFINVVDFSGIIVDADVEDGFEIVNVTYDDDIAEVQTQGGEKFRFRRTDDGIWSSELPWDAYQAWKNRDRWIANLTQAEKNVEQLRRRVDEQRDPRTPEGAVNVFRDSSTQNRLDALYTLLDDKTKTTLADIVRRAHDLSGVAQPESEQWKLAREAKTGRDLFEVLWTQKHLGKTMPSAEDRIIRIERDTNSSVVAVLTSGKKTHLIRGKQDIWRIMGLSAEITALFGNVVHGGEQ